MRIFLVRHGQTPSNARRVVQLPETPLSDLGFAQAGRLARRLANEGVRLILSSDLPRADQTAKVIAEATGAPIEHDERLQERNFGDLRGRAYDEIGLDIFAPHFVPPRGESWDQFHERVAHAWEDIKHAALDAHGNLAVVAHGLLCYSICSRHVEIIPDVLGEPQEVPLRFGNAALTVIRGESPWHVEVINCTAHLRGLEAELSRPGAVSPPGAV